MSQSNPPVRYDSAVLSASSSIHKAPGQSGARSIQRPIDAPARAGSPPMDMQRHTCRPGLVRPVEARDPARCYLAGPPTPSSPARGACAAKPAERSPALSAGFGLESAPRHRPPACPGAIRRSLAATPTARCPCFAHTRPILQRKTCPLSVVTAC